MGSMIQLAVGRLEIDWGKNFGFNDHSTLFQRTDLATVPYYYVDTPKGLDANGRYHLLVEHKEGLAKSLHLVIDRINFLGHTIRYTRREFNYLSKLNGFDADRFGFDDLAGALGSVDVQMISADYGEGGEDF
jgi:hypothetical protein